MWRKLLWRWWSRTVYDNWDGYVLKEPNYEDDMRANEREIKIYKIFIAHNIAYVLWEVDLDNSTKENLYMKKITSFNPSNVSWDYDIRDESNRKIKEKVESISEWNRDYINFSIFCWEVSDSEEWQRLKELGHYIYPDIFEEYVKLYNVFNTYWKDFKLFLDVVNKYDMYYDFHIWWIHMDNVGYDEDYNIKILDFWG